MELEKKQTLMPLYKRVSLTGVQEIHNYLRAALDQRSYVYFPLNWSWEWLVIEGQYRGKLPNRLTGMLKTCQDVKLTPEQKSTIGNIARKHLLAKDNYTIDFTDTFDWMAGDFGDHGSCFWGDNLGAREVMEEEGVIAIRFYDREDNGIGRAWLYELSNGAWIVFNAYGLECPEAASVLAMKLTEDTENTWEYEQMDNFLIRGNARGLVYINNRPQMVYRKGYSHGLSVDLDWYIPYGLCAMCGEWLHMDEAYYDKEFGEPYCHGCYEVLLTEREEKRLAELEERLEQEMEEDFRGDAGRAEIAYTMAQEAIRNDITAQLVAGQMVMLGVWEIYAAPL